MKINEPVTQTESPLSEHSLLISRTDLKGIIGFCNEEFISTSGFSQEELEGSNHNLVRHPDMPSALFRDLWLTLKEGGSWKGVIKNRCKNGDFYWVYAHVTPVYEREQVVGYVSVRRKPTSTQISEAITLYKRINEGTAKFPTTLENIRFSIPKLLSKKSFLIGTSLVTILCILATQTPNFPFGISASILAVISFLSTIAGYSFREKFNHIKANKDENELIDKLKYVLAETNKSSQQFKMASAQLESKNNDLQARNESQISSVVQTQAAISSLSDQLKTNRTAAERAATLTELSRDRANEGSTVIKETIGAMNNISSGSQDIENIIEIINEISFQTNLLALNASVEAAHAGDAGRGFSIVATEVRNLSQRTSAAAEEITRLISSSSQHVSTGQTLVHKSEHQLSELVSTANTVNELVDSISNQSTQQHISIDEVNISMREIEAMTLENAQLVQHTSQVSVFLSRQAESLNELLGFFSVERTHH